MTDIQQGVPSARSAGRGFRAYSAKHLDTLVQRAGLPPEERLAVRAVATVLPFRTNSYVVEHLIDWDAAPDDPIYRLVFPQPDMLPEADVRRLADMIDGGEPAAGLRAAAHEIRMRLNPHPAGQLLLNPPSLGAGRCRACSTSTRKPCCSSPGRARPATRTAATASAGPSSWTSPT